MRTLFPGVVWDIYDCVDPMTRPLKIGPLASRGVSVLPSPVRCPDPDASVPNPGVLKLKGLESGYSPGRKLNRTGLRLAEHVSEKPSQYRPKDSEKEASTPLWIFRPNGWIDGADFNLFRLV